MKEIVLKNAKQIDDNIWKCLLCGKEFSKYGIANHLSVSCLKIRKHSTQNHKAWNKGLTKETSEKVKQCGETHTRHIKEGKIIPHWTGKKIKTETKQKISESMKKAHADGRAWNIGKSRWNNQPSWPEKFMMEVIENELENKDYIREFPFHKFSIDFMWPSLKKAIEIDGEQHEKFEEQKRRDKEKDALLENEGFELLRIKWKDFVKNTKFWISEIKTFIDK